MSKGLWKLPPWLKRATEATQRGDCKCRGVRVMCYLPRRAAYKNGNGESMLQSAKQERRLYLSTRHDDRIWNCSAGFQSCCGPHFLTIP